MRWTTYDTGSENEMLEATVTADNGIRIEYAIYRYSPRVGIPPSGYWVQCKRLDTQCELDIGWSLGIVEAKNMAETFHKYCSHVI